MNFGDWSKFTIQLQHTDEADGDKVKDATVGRDGVGPVVFDVWQRELPVTVTAVGGFGASSTGLDARCGDDGTQDCGVSWSTRYYLERKTDDKGQLTFFVYAPADPDPGTEGTVRTLVVRAWEKVNGPAASGNTNKRLHYFYVRVSEGTRTTSGVVPTTTVPAGEAAAAFTVMSYGAKTNKELARDTSFVEAEFGDEAGITVQLKDANGANTSTGVDGSTPAWFTASTITATDLVSRVYRDGTDDLFLWADTQGTFTAASESLATGDDGSVSFAMEMADHDTSTPDSRGSIGFVLRAGTNAPGTTGNDATTAVRYGIIRFTEPPPPPTTTTTTTTTVLPATTTTPAESVHVEANNATVRKTKTTDGEGTEYYLMKFGDWSKFTIQLQHTDEADGGKVKDTTVGRDGVGAVLFDVWQRELPDAVTALTGVGATSTGLAPRCGVDGTRTCSRAWSDVFRVELKTDSNGQAVFYVYAPADPDTGTAGTVRTLLVRVWEKMNGPAASGNANKRLHYFYVRVSEGDRATSGGVPTTTVPAGEKAADFMLTSIGARSDKVLGGTSSFVEAEFGDQVLIKAQLLDAEGAATTAGVDGKNPATLEFYHLYTTGQIAAIRKGDPPRGWNSIVTWADSVRGTFGRSFWVQGRTGVEGSYTFPLNIMNDPDTTATGSTGSIGVIVRAYPNAPGAVAGDDAATAAKYGIVRLTETTNTTTTTTTTTTPATTTTVALSIADVNAAEDGTFTFTVTATPVPTAEVTFKYTVTKEASDTATAGGDFVAVTTPTEASMTANASTATITVTVTDDDLDEDDETFTVSLSDASANATIIDATATGTITDDDNSPVLAAIDDVSVKLGQAVDIAAAATDADGDTVTFAWTRKTGETMPVIPETPDLGAARLMFTPPAEGTYTMTVTASDANGNTDTATVVITVAKAVTVSVTELTVDEGDIGTYTIKLNSEPSGDVTVTVGGESGDVTVTGSPLTFTTANYNVAQTITVNAGTDSDTDTDPPVTLTHTATGGDYNSATIDSVTVSITEAAPTFQLLHDPADVTEGTDITLVVTSDRALIGNVPVRLKLVPRTRSSKFNAKDIKGNLGPRNFDAIFGDTPSTTGRVSISTKSDQNNEGSEDYRITLRSKRNYVVGTDKTADGTLLDGSSGG